MATELPKILADPRQLERLDQYPLERDLQALSTVCNFFENVGTLVKHEIIDRDIALDMWSLVITINWERLASFIAGVGGSRAGRRSGRISNISPSWRARTSSSIQTAITRKAWPGFP